jgi:hypothetical protein
MSTTFYQMHLWKFVKQFKYIIIFLLILFIFKNLLKHWSAVNEQQSGKTCCYTRGKAEESPPLSHFRVCVSGLLHVWFGFRKRLLPLLFSENKQNKILFPFFLSVRLLFTVDIGERFQSHLWPSVRSPYNISCCFNFRLAADEGSERASVCVCVLVRFL